jgi:hypothetical protein
MSRISRSQWVLVATGPVLALVGFVATYYIDPLNFGHHAPLAAIPAFLLSIVILLITHNVASFLELEKTSQDSDRIYEAVKDYLHVTKVGSPEKAIQYVVARLPSLQDVRNTSLTIVDEAERVDERLYETDSYVSLSRQVAFWTSRRLRWKDIGDVTALPRMRATAALALSGSEKTRLHYQYRLIEHREPQINFILLTYPDATAEVLFNWDFRNIGQDPVVLLSRDRDIVEMFAVQFECLWRAASFDHDSTATRSTSNQ